jgi:hypothetical protein
LATVSPSIELPSPLSVTESLSDIHFPPFAPTPEQNMKAFSEDKLKQFAIATPEEKLQALQEYTALLATSLDNDKKRRRAVENSESPTPTRASARGEPPFEALQKNS